MLKVFQQSILMLAIMTAVTGFAYPLAVTLVAQTFFQHQANGSLIKNSAGEVVGSELLGQQFAQAKYFHSRPSATSPFPYNAGGSSGSNLGPTNPELKKQVEARVKQCELENRGNSNNSKKKIPIDLVTTSASGLDPDISVESAIYQSDRIATARNLPQKDVLNVIDKCREDRQFGFLGEPRVNVLRLNLLLDGPK